MASLACCCSARDVSPPIHQAPSTGENQPRSPETDFDFVEQPSQDFFCPVSLELLLEPQLTSCCGHHLSLEATTRLQRERKPCPMCNGEGWNAVLDKYHRRRVHEVRVRCRYKDNGCDWVGEVNKLKGHVNSCVKGLWECRYCAFRCTFGGRVGKHLATCPNFPEPCPNSCEVGSVERCNMEQHLSVCPLEPVACEMKEFGCNVVVPRKELATHMRESELQHLTAMTMTNLRLTRQLQQESKERDEKIDHLTKERKQQIAQLQRKSTERMSQLRQEMDRKITSVQREISEQKKMQAEVLCTISQLQSDLAAVKIETRKHSVGELGAVATSLLPLQHKTSSPQPTQTAASVVGSETSGSLSVTHYTQHKLNEDVLLSDPFYTHVGGYKFKLQIIFHERDIGAGLYLMKGEYDRQLHWPVEVDVHLELLNQTSEFHGHVTRTKNLTWKKNEKERAFYISDCIVKYSTLERNGLHMQNDCLKFNVTVDVL